jgi:hypothetical protein
VRQPGRGTAGRGRSDATSITSSSPATGGRLPRSRIQHALRRLGGRAGLEGVRTNPHTFRHTFAKLYLLNGGDLFSLQRILGHTSLDMVRRYVNLDTGEVKRQHAQASPVDRLVVGPKVSVILPRELAARLEAIAWWRRMSVAELVRRGPEQLVERSRDAAWQWSARAA